MFRLLGDPNQRELKRLEPLVSRIGAYEENLVSLANEALQEKTVEFRRRLSEGEALDDLLPEAFACVREAAKRMLGQRHFDAQLFGGVALHLGKIAEMRTGEGKTLAATAPVYLNALGGKGVHVITVNDYLAKRDAVWMGQIYAALGMTASCVTQEGSYRYRPPIADNRQQQDADQERDTQGAFRVVEDFLEPVTKRVAYACVFTYGTNNEFGFDYLRDF
ncbi:MAG: preprotein translocase subunit SecA, partial [Candidatus Terrybacteria bacterium]|nr:preprotein translocase subunit SecA [Candidatus Terrybacteria bacterium]